MSFLVNYLDMLKIELDELRRREKEVYELVDDLVNFSSSKELFKDHNKFYFKLYRVQSLLGEYISFLLRLESKEYSKVEGEVKLPVKSEEKSRPTFLSKLKRKVSTINPVIVQRETSTIEYGRKLLERIDQLLNQYRYALYLIQHQDVDEIGERIEYLKVMYQSYITDLASDIRSFTKAAIQLRRIELEKLLENILKNFVKG